MKKLIAISVMCALVAGAAFADTTVGGALFVGGKFVEGDSSKHSHPQAGAIDKDAYNSIIKTTFGNNEVGGWFSLHMNGGNANPYHWFAWWRPIPQIRLQLGRNTDGDFGAAQITGWGWVGEAKNASNVAMGEYSGPMFGLAHARKGYYEGTGATPNFQLSFFPLDGLAINLWIPFANNESVALTFAKFELNVAYDIVDIGKLAVSFQMAPGYHPADPSEDGPRVVDGDYDKYQETSWWGGGEITDTPKVFASFFLTAIENMGVELGLAYKFPLKYSYDIAETKYVDEYTYNYKQNFPLEIGLGFRYNLGDFQIKLRGAVTLAGSVEQTNKKTFVDEKVKDATQISVHILPNYKIGIATIFLYAGLGIQIIDDWETTKKTPDMAFGGFTAGQGGGYVANESNAAVSWFVNPYVRLSTGGINFLVGLQIYSDGIKYPNGDPALVKWAIPFGFYTYF